MNERCIHGELDAVCRACCDPLTVDDWACDHEDQRMPVELRVCQQCRRLQIDLTARRRSGAVVVACALALVVIAAIAWGMSR